MVRALAAGDHDETRSVRRVRRENDFSAFSACSAWYVATLTALLIANACSSKPPREPLRLEGNRLTVFNDTDSDWTDVEIWLNRQFRLTVPKIEHGAPFTAPLDVFVEGFGRRFDFKRMQIRDLRLKAKNAAGAPFELQKEFTGDGLEDALKGFKKK